MILASALPGLSQRLALILGSLRAVLAAGMGREPARVALLLLAWPYLHRLEARFASLVARLASGRVIVPAFRSAAVTPRERRPWQRLPHRFGWMIQMVPGARPLASQVRHLLADPEFCALLAAAPQSGRLLRPLCRMLGIARGADLPPALLSPPPRSAARQTAPAAPPEAPVTAPLTAIMSACAPFSPKPE